jgi:hypothetical protein
MELAQLACPLCDGVFQVDIAWQGTQVACPHCEQAVTVPVLEFEPPAEAPRIVVEPEAKPAKSREPQREPSTHVDETAPPPISRIEALKLARRLPATAARNSPFAVRDVSRRVRTATGQTVELRRRTPDERSRFRRRLQLAVALTGAVVLAVLLTVLLQLG